MPRHAHGHPHRPHHGARRMNRADVIIIGGGIMGASAAFFLRQHGQSVILLERGLIGQQAPDFIRRASIITFMVAAIGTQ